MTDIKWQEPPADGRTGHAAFQSTLEALRSNPGRWALVAEGVSASRAHTIKSKPGYEATVRKSATGNGGKYDLYARFVGEEPA